MSDAPAPGARQFILAFLGTFAIMFLAPLIPYGALSILTGLEPPGSGSGAAFLVGVVVMKLGIAFGFVAIFHLGREVLSGRWLGYAGAWWLMYAIVEAGQAIAPAYSWQEAGAGVVAEAIYFPLSARLVERLLGMGRVRRADRIDRAGGER